MQLHRMPLAEGCRELASEESTQTTEAVFSSLPIFTMLKFTRVSLFVALFLTACTSELPEPFINTDQHSYKFTGTGFLLSGYIGADCDCTFAVSIDGENVEIAEGGVFQKYIEPHYTTDDGEVEIITVATSNGFRSLESQSEKRVAYKRTVTDFRILDAPTSYDQEEVTLSFSGTPYTEVQDASWKMLITLDEHGSGSVTLSLKTDYDYKSETVKFHARAEGYDTKTMSITLKNGLYDAKRIASEKEAVEQKKREVQEAREQEAKKKREAEQQAQAEQFQLKQEQQRKLEKRNELYAKAKTLSFSENDADVLVNWFERQGYEKDNATEGALNTLKLHELAVFEAGKNYDDEGALREARMVLLNLKFLSPEMSFYNLLNSIIGGQDALNERIIGTKDLLYFIQYLNIAFTKDASTAGFSANEFIGVAVMFLISEL